MEWSTLRAQMRIGSLTDGEHGTATPTENHAPTIKNGSSVDLVTADFDSDSISILFGDDTGEFSATKIDLYFNAEPRAVAIADLNGDGDSDIVVANSERDTSEPVTILLADGAGGYAVSTTGLAGGWYPLSMQVVDLNGDGDLDIVTGNWGSADLSILVGDGMGGFTASRQSIGDGSGGPYDITVGYVNGDALPDIVTANENTGGISILKGKVGGGFDVQVVYPVDSHAPSSIELGDVNNDGKTDIVITDLGNSAIPDSVKILTADGSGAYTTTTIATGGSDTYGLAVGDINDDGNLDIVTANTGSDNLTVLLGNGAGAFGATIIGSGGNGPLSIALIDVNADGELDIVTANVAGSDVSILLGDGTGAFSGATTGIAGGLAPASIAFGDLTPIRNAFEDTPYVFSSAAHTAIAVSDADAGDGVETVTLTVEHGFLTLGSTEDLTSLSGNGTNSLVFSGTIESLSAALDGLTYLGAPEFSGSETLNISINDNGNTGGDALSDLAAISLTVIAVDDPAVACDDLFAINESQTLSGNVLIDNGAGADSDIDGPSLRVGAVNGLTYAVGELFFLPSGSLLELDADGSFEYTPGGSLLALPSPDSGAHNLTQQDTFTYMLANGNTATVTITVGGEDSNDLLAGTNARDAMHGGIGYDQIYGYQRDDRLFGDDGDDAVFGGRGDDSLYGGNGDDALHGLGNDDRIEGGAGADTLDGGRGADVFKFANAADSTGLVFDRIVAAVFAIDTVDVPTSITGIDATVDGGRLSESRFDAQLAAAVDAAHLAANHAVVFLPDSGPFKGEIFLVVDLNGVAGYQSGGDLVVNLDHPAHLESLSTSTFV